MDFWNFINPGFRILRISEFRIVEAQSPEGERCQAVQDIWSNRIVFKIWGEKVVFSFNCSLGARSMVQMKAEPLVGAWGPEGPGVGGGF